MSMPMTTGSLARLLAPGVSDFFMNKYKEHETQYDKLFEIRSSKRNFEEDVGLVGFGLMSRKDELDAIVYDTMRQGWTVRYYMTTYGLGFMISRELVEDNMYSEVALKKATMLAMSARQTKEIIAANVYNRAFNGSYTGGDGVSLLNASHPNVSGGTYSNKLTTPSNLNGAALEQAIMDIRKWVDDRGNRVNFKPQSLVIPVDYEFEVERLFKSTLMPGSANNDINVWKSSGKFPKGVHMNNYLTSTTAWYIRTDCPEGMKFYERRALEFGTENDFDTENAKFKATERYGCGWTDPKGLFGSEGV